MRYQAVSGPKIGDRVRELRAEKKLSMSRLAKEAGFSKSYIHQIEQNVGNPTQRAIEKIADYFGCSARYLTGETDKRGQDGGSTSMLTHDEDELLFIYRALSADNKRILKKVAKGIAVTAAEEQEERKVVSISDAKHPAVTDEEEMVAVRLLVDVAAGAPIQSDRRDDEVMVPKRLVPKKNAVAARAIGDSMIDAGIEDRDILVGKSVRSSRNYQVGDVVVAVINENELTVKRYAGHTKGKRRLKPENSAMEMMEFDEGKCQIHAVVTARRDRSGKWHPVSRRSAKWSKN